MPYRIYDPPEELRAKVRAKRVKAAGRDLPAGEETCDIIGYSRYV